MIIFDYLAYELSLIILGRCEKCFCTPPLRWSGENLKTENGSASCTKSAKNPQFLQNWVVAAVQKKEANIQMSWVELFQESQLLQHFGQRSTNSICKKLTKTRKEQHFNLLPSSQGLEIMRLLTLWERSWNLCANPLKPGTIQVSNVDGNLPKGGGGWGHF